LCPDGPAGKYTGVAGWCRTPRAEQSERVRYTYDFSIDDASDAGQVTRRVVSAMT